MRGIIFGQVQCMRGMDFVAGGGDERYYFWASAVYEGHGFCGRWRR